jgi:triosephosphate isomerase
MAHLNRGIFMAGNWKMYKNNTDARQFVLALAQEMPTHPALEAWVCAGFTLLATTVRTAKEAGLSLHVAAQNMEIAREGAFTGEVSPTQLEELDLQGVVLGHSERRSYYNESNAAVNAKTKSALAHGLVPIVCVGETLSEREAEQTDAVVTQQIQESLKDLSAEQISRVVVAYEPVWAIGTGKVCEPAEANRVCGVIRQSIASTFGSKAAETLRILYGGSMKPDNAAGLLAQSDIDGGLIGGASLEADSFRQLLSIASQELNALEAVVA